MAAHHPQRREDPQSDPPLPPVSPIHEAPQSGSSADGPTHPIGQNGPHDPSPAPDDEPIHPSGAGQAHPSPRVQGPLDLRPDDLRPFDHGGHDCAAGGSRSGDSGAHDSGAHVQRADSSHSLPQHDHHDPGHHDDGHDYEHEYGHKHDQDPGHDRHGQDLAQGLDHDQSHGQGLDHDHHDPGHHDCLHEHKHEHVHDRDLDQDHGHGNHGQSNHGHSHPHHRAGSGASGAFRWSIVLNGLLTGLQLVVGFGFGSLALIGDALHNLGDVVGLALGWGAERLSLRPPSGRFTYGYGRSTHLASLLNGLLIFSAGAVVVVEAIQRFVQPVNLVAGPVAWAAAAGIVVNLVSARLFGHGHQHDLNRRAAVLHLLTDAAVSVAVLISALLVSLTGWLWLDALTALAVGLVVIGSAWGILQEALALNLDAAPAHISLELVRESLLELPGVLAVEELHVWGVSTSRTVLTAHLRCRSGSGFDAAVLLEQARQRLADLGIRKSTLQLHTSAAEFSG